MDSPAKAAPQRFPAPIGERTENVPFSSHLALAGAASWRELVRLFRFAFKLTILPALILLASPNLHAAAGWVVRVEEPTGLYPRTNELVAVP